MQNYILGIFTAFLIYTGCSVVYDWLNLPTVYKNYLTRECVKVETASGITRSCDQMPEKYHQVWVH